MKTLILVALFVVAVHASPIEEHLNKFTEFKLKHGKTYQSQEEESKRFAIFSGNVDRIEQHNALYEQGLETYKMGINRFTDWSQDEFVAYLTSGGKPRPVLNATRYVKTGAAVPDSVDWRTTGQVSPVKDQGGCGACWAFSLTGAIEAAYYRATNQSVLLSEQQLVDCTYGLNDNAGCGGGWLDTTYPYIEEYGLQSEEAYPYTEANGDCVYNASDVVVKVSGHVAFEKDEGALLEVVGTIGPVSVLMDASLLFLYESGIFSPGGCDPTFLSHAVLVIGYGAENDVPYWLLKNQWGTDWGEKGYFRLFRGDNRCGVAEDDVYPIIA